MKVHKPKTVKEAIDTLQEFLQCDLYSKFRPEKELDGEIWVRDDMFENESEFYKYIEYHFEILREQINEISSKL